MSSGSESSCVCVLCFTSHPSPWSFLFILFFFFFFLLLSIRECSDECGVKEQTMLTPHNWWEDIHTVQQSQQSQWILYNLLQQAQQIAQGMLTDITSLKNSLSQTLQRFLLIPARNPTQRLQLHAAICRQCAAGHEQNTLEAFLSLLLVLPTNNSTTPDTASSQVEYFVQLWSLFVGGSWILELVGLFVYQCAVHTFAACSRCSSNEGLGSRLDSAPDSACFL